MIDYTKIAKSIDYYTKKGYQEVDAPWLVPGECVDATKPEGAKSFSTFAGDLVASGEQSFIAMLLSGEFKYNRFLKYICTTPCFRDEDSYDELKKQWFIKTELIHPDTNEERDLKAMIRLAKSFFNKYVETEVIETHEGYDIIDRKTKIELGSYGFRSYGKWKWIYGTGCAEPRLSESEKIFKKKYFLAIGDWSHDGHNLSKNFAFTTNKDENEIHAAYRSACDEMGVFLDSSCKRSSEYIMGYHRQDERLAVSRGLKDNHPRMLTINAGVMSAGADEDIFPNTETRQYYPLTEYLQNTIESVPLQRLIRAGVNFEKIPGKEDEQGNWVGITPKGVAILFLEICKTKLPDLEWKWVAKDRFHKNINGYWHKNFNLGFGYGIFIPKNMSDRFTSDRSRLNETMERILAKYEENAKPMDIRSQFVLNSFKTRTNKIGKEEVQYYVD